MKKILALLLSLCAVMTACGGTVEKASETETETEAAELAPEKPAWLGYDDGYESFKTASLKEYSDKMVPVKDITEFVTSKKGSTTYISIASPYFDTPGLVYDDSTETFSRIGIAIGEDARNAQSLYAAGTAVRFITDANSVWIKVTTDNPSKHLKHTCSTAAFSTDYFVGSGTAYTIAGTLKVEKEPKGKNTMQASLNLQGGQPSEVIVVLPLCTGIQDVEIGFPNRSKIAMPEARTFSKALCFYGSDNILGYGVVKPSETFVNLLSRKLDINTINLGLPGTAKGSDTDAQYIASLDISALLINYSSDLKISEITDNYLNFYKKIRETRPDLPIIMMSDPIFDTYKENPEEKAARDAVYQAYLGAGEDANLYFIDGDWLLPTRFRELYTVDNHLLNGVGHEQTAKILYSAFKYILTGSNELSEQTALVFDDAKAAPMDESTLKFNNVSEISGDAVIRKENGKVYLDGLTKDYFELTGVQRPEDNKNVLYRLDFSKYRKYSALNKEYAYYQAGERIRFVTDSKTVDFEFTYLTSPNIIFFHFPDTGHAGVDVYCGTGSERKFLGNIAHTERADKGTVTKGSFTLPDGVNEIYIDMPIYSAIEKITVGLEDGSKIALPQAYAYHAPVCFYGSSITEGACATKPSSAYFNILARMLNFECLNLGFSGSALGETYASDYIAKTEISAFVMDYDHNAPSAEHLKATHYNFYRAVRDAHPDIPIILMTMPYYAAPTSYNNDRKNVIKATYTKARKEGDENIYYIDAEKFFPKHNRDLYTVDFTHPNDNGFLHMAEAVYPVLKTALEKTYGH